MAGAKTIKPLTTKTIEAMKPSNADLADIEENRGLRVSCGKTGAKTFIYRYKSPVDAKLKQIKIGRFPEVTLTEARGALRQYKQIRAEGRCPATEKKEKADKHERSVSEVDSSFTVEDLVELYLVQRIEDRKTKDGRLIPGARKPKGQAETRRTLHGDVVRVMGSREAASVTRQDVIDLIMEIVDRGANVQAGNVLREWSLAFEFALGLGKLPYNFVNPAFLAKSSLKQAAVRLTSERGKRALDDSELVRLLEWLPKSDFTQTIKQVLMLSLWTGCRTGELCAAEWKDVDLNNGTFRIADSKTGTDRTVQLPRQAVSFLKALRSVTGDYLFPSQKTKLPIQQKQLTEQAWRLRERGSMLNIDRWTPHDLRRTVRTGLSRLKCPSEVGEAVLGHARKGIEGTYDLHRYEDECREWLQKWADHLEALTAQAAAS